MGESLALQRVSGRQKNQVFIKAAKAGCNLEANPTLRLATQKAKAINLLKDKTENVIKKGLANWLVAYAFLRKRVRKQ